MGLHARYGAGSRSGSRLRGRVPAGFDAFPRSSITILLGGLTRIEER
jgi:hypothetical protein